MLLSVTITHNFLNGLDTTFGEKFGSNKEEEN